MIRGKKARAVTAPARTQAGTNLQAPITSELAVLSAGLASHKTQHQNGGSDELSIAGLSGLAADPQTPASHKASHENGGADEISLAGLSGLAGDPQTPIAHASRHEDGGDDEIDVTGLAGLLADEQMPLPHEADHRLGGGDEIDVTTLGGYPGGATTFLRDDGTFAAPVAGASGSFTTVEGKTVTVVDGIITLIV